MPCQGLVRIPRSVNRNRTQGVPVYVNQETLDQCVQEWLANPKDLQPASMFNRMDRGDENTDFILTFFQYLVSRCVVRHAPCYASYGIYAFSAPGRKIMSNDASRTAFIGEFMKFYGY